MSDVPINQKLTVSEVEIIALAMRWYETQWPHDPEAQSRAPAPFFPMAGGEVLPPKVEVVHHDGWRIGRIITEDGIAVFVRDYAEIDS